ncbi:GNAT family N-acetyltransferase [Janthinobacterium sp.]|uniref:GNAT family N-acetyltransferase n=1 Tax=Janthinobacterium sp. TaxID=1871054 RepID=UPI00293D86B7|nr:GNAT family N-acetyltransferase [Janthinobacterium sp.]
MTPARVRMARAEDGDAVRGIAAVAMRDFGLEPDFAGLDRELGLFGQAVRGGGAQLVAEVDGRVAGSLILAPAGARTLKLSGFYVDAALRGRGVGRALLLRAIAFAREGGNAGIELETWDKMAAAVALYTTLGWRRGARLPAASGAEWAYTLDLDDGAAPAIRRLTPQHAQAYRALMLEAYALHPDAFTSSVAERAGLPLAWWQARLDTAPQAAAQVFGVFDAAGLAGVAGLSFEARDRTRHKATLFGMYIPQRCRQRGYGRRLLDALLAAAAAARPGLKLVQLTVSEGNEAARALYEAGGFAVFGVEPYAVALDDAYVGKVHMWRLL